MSSKKVRALVISGYGINCEKELALACEMAGAAVEVEHAYSLLSRQTLLKRFDFLLFPGGFSFGDELGAGKVFANRLSYKKKCDETHLYEELRQFVTQGKCILGICNGFQLLVRLGLLPDFDQSNVSQKVALAANENSQFECRWVRHKVCESPCIFTKGLEHLYLPIRHAEGRLVAAEKEVTARLFDRQQVALQYATKESKPTMSYPENPNGSSEAIAGICDPSGRVLGMMAHPEAALLFTNHPQWIRKKEQIKRAKGQLPLHGEGFLLFENAVKYLKGVL